MVKFIIKKIFILLAICFTLFNAKICFSHCETSLDGREVCDFVIADWNGIPTSSAPATSDIGKIRTYMDSTLGKWQCSEDGGAYTNCVGGGGSGTYSKEFEIKGGKLTGGDITNGMGIDAGERPWSGRFDDTTAEEVTFQWAIDPNYSAGTLSFDIDFSMESTQTGSTNVKYDAKIMCVTGSTDSISWDSDSFATAQTVTHALASNQTADYLRKATITFTQAQADAMAVADTCRLHLKRDTAVASDATGDAKIATLIIHE